MLKFVINLVVFTIIGGLVGWIIGKLLTYPVVAYKNYRLKRMMKRADEMINEAFADIIQWN